MHSPRRFFQGYKLHGSSESPRIPRLQPRRTVEIQPRDEFHTGLKLEESSGEPVQQGVYPSNLPNNWYQSQVRVGDRLRRVYMYRRWPEWLAAQRAPQVERATRMASRCTPRISPTEITLPFGEALQQIPLYTKFMKDILTKKGKYIDNESIMVGGNCNAMIQRKLPEKFKDPRSVTIPCTIGNKSVGKTLIDLGASINLMPLSLCRRIGNLKINPTKMTLQLTDRSITRPYEVVEDVLVKVRHFTFPVDFVIMDIEDAEIPLILGRPFMLIANYVVDMGNCNLEMSIND
ncbi:uncharacterized protein [Glycine max]|uniref:uncharacterized protein n=1 Tax=Glycine max TaxID=3847 RepID=UPI0003DE7546|nr:uncharacterized protein LOC102663510 [Glycine max]|eukprot:XP_006599953.1 uncharacterized protein LOC102663510 [Glycine max]